MRVMFQLKKQPGGGWVVKSWTVKFCCWSSGFNRPLLVTQCINDLWEQSLLPGCGWRCSKLTGWSLWIEKNILDHSYKIIVEKKNRSENYHFLHKGLQLYLLQKASRLKYTWDSPDNWSLNIWPPLFFSYATWHMSFSL